VSTEVVIEHPPPSARGMPTPMDSTTGGVTVVSVAAMVPQSPVLKDRVAAPADANSLAKVKLVAGTGDVGVADPSLHAMPHVTSASVVHRSDRQLMGR
jgi:hypothetical protein